jgi:hypothetical protein
MHELDSLFLPLIEELVILNSLIETSKAVWLKVDFELICHEDESIGLIKDW